MDPQTLVAFALLAAAVITLVRRLRRVITEVEGGNACSVCEACRSEHSTGTKLLNLSSEPPRKP